MNYLPPDTTAVKRLREAIRGYAMLVNEFRTNLSFSSTRLSGLVEMIETYSMIVASEKHIISRKSSKWVWLKENSRSIARNYSATISYGL